MKFHSLIFILKQSIMNNQLEFIVSFPLAKLVQSHNFDWPTLLWYMGTNDIAQFYSISAGETVTNTQLAGDTFTRKYAPFACAAPTQAHLSQWFREKHQFLIIIETDSDLFSFIIVNMLTEADLLYDADFNSYQEAMEEALTQMCSLLNL